MTATLLDRYIRLSMKTVQGFLTTLDARLIRTLLGYQLENEIAGHLCEIGVHHGKLFLMLALARRPEERALGIDLFEDDAGNTHTRHAGRNRALFENARRLHIEFAEEEIFKTSSLDIGPAEILARTGGRIRFFSVDGGHLYHHVEGDLRLAERTITEHGIIAVDDFFNPGWVDISFAAYDFLRSTGSIVPFAITPKKLYLAPAAAAESYRQLLAGRATFANIEPVKILDKPVMSLSQRPIEKGYEFLRHQLSAVRRRA